MACANNFTFCLYGVVLWSPQIGTGCIDIDKRWVKIDNVKIYARWVKFDSGGVKFDNIKICLLLFLNGSSGIVEV